MNLTISKKWPFFSWLLALTLASPFAAIVWQSFANDQDIFNHLYQTVLPDYIFNSFALTVAVVAIATLIGVPCAWLIANYEFPLRRYFQWALILPLAMPSYVVAFVYTDLLECAGPIQTSLRQLLEPDTVGTHCYFQVRNLGGASLMLALVLFPYIYLLMRACFNEQSSSLINSARVMGCNTWQTFYRLSFPLARPALAVGITLVAMETLADFAVVKYFAVSTLTTAVYDTWLGYGSLAAAARISAIMLLAIFLLIGIEKYARRQQKYYQHAVGQETIVRPKLKRPQQIITLLFLSIVFFAAFLFPFLRLIEFAFDYFSESWNAEFIEYSLNSLLVASLVSLFCLLFGLIFGYYKRLSQSKTREVPGKLASAGYALPGTVLAIGVLIPLTMMDSGVNSLFKSMGTSGPGLILSGSLFAIIFGYVIRFSAIAVGSVDASLAKVPPSLDMASTTMGLSPLKTMFKVHMPLVSKGLFVAALLVFIESMKELPAALLLRPFGFESLATYVYQFVSDEQLELGALAAIVIVVVGLIPLIFLDKYLDSTQPSNSKHAKRQ
ncbi:iron ABC transporter permease [Aliikangiella marina]|uniref:Iron ABC transporter permease n=1 Tax=Aliikangiella marina TaxID=1712262 RepID=A0A545TDB7_9GAMM|nr:iron ABC transporter permease [Aliikangiella marina]TQV75217.1 iron ABC transporter permease [Aliikangiella marina]